MVQRVVQRARDELAGVLYERGGRSVAELAEEMGVSQGSIRRHLDLMGAEGLIETTLVRQPRGRPVTRYSLSEAGEERSGAEHYTSLIGRLLPALADGDLAPGQVGYRPKLHDAGEPQADFLVWRDGAYVHLGGIESPGLTCALPLAARVAELLR